MQNIRLLFLFTFFCLTSLYSSSQCCSVGSPAGASENIGIINKNTLRVNTFFRQSISQNYYEGTKKLKNYGLVNRTFFDYSHINIGYGLFNKLTIEGELGYFISKTQIYNIIPEYRLKGSGLNTVNIITKYSLYKCMKSGIEITSGLGVKIPLVLNNQYYNNVLLPPEIQPSTGAFGGIINLYFAKNWDNINLKAFLFHRTDYNTENKNNYKYGTTVSNSLFIIKQIFKDFSTAIEIRYENKFADIHNRIEKDNTGNEIVILSPRINYSFNKWSISTASDIPIYKNYKGKQIGLYYSFAINLSYELCFISKLTSPMS